MAPIPLPTWDQDVDAHFQTLQRPPNDEVLVRFIDANGKVKPEETQHLTYYELSYNNKILKFTLEGFGARPKDGYALYIALHGGGGDKDATRGNRVNNGLWYQMAKGLYRKNFKDPDNKNGTVDNAIYCALRGVDDTWDCHFRPESYVLLERLIMILLRPSGTPLVDSNRIFLVGFSAGGDGVYRLATNLSDRFAAANMSAGHPGNKVGDSNRVHFENLANLPFCSQVGEDDNTIEKKGVRAHVVVGANDELDGLEKDEPGYYPHACFVHAKGTHNSWERAEDGTAKSAVFTNPHDWSLGLRGGQATEEKNTNAIDWMNQWYPRSRNPVPSLVVWNLASRPPPLDANPGQPVAAWDQKRFFYWLYLRNPDSKTFDAKAIIRASYNTSGNWIQIDEPNDYVAILLNEKMVDLNKPIIVYPGPTKDGKTKPVTITVKRSDKIEQRTLEARGDRQLVFSAMIYFESKGGNNWDVKTVDTLDLAAPVKARL